jgi:steroid delta-isomerase-like uncharacterized protein
MSKENKALVRQMVEQVWQAGNTDAIDEFLAADVVDHSVPPGMPPGRKGSKAWAAMMTSAMTGSEITIEDEIAEGDLVVTRWSSQATHTGDLMGIPATGKRVSITGISINRILDGKIVESWGEADMMGMMQQLGVVPAPAQGGD